MVMMISLSENTLDPGIDTNIDECCCAQYTVRWKRKQAVEFLLIVDTDENMAT